MRRGILSLVAVALSIPVLYGAIRSTQTFETAAMRIVVLAMGVAFIDRYAAPVVDAIVRSLANDQTAPGETSS